MSAITHTITKSYFAEKKSSKCPVCFYHSTKHCEHSQNLKTKTGLNTPFIGCYNNLAYQERNPTFEEKIFNQIKILTRAVPTGCNWDTYYAILMKEFYNPLSELTGTTMRIKEEKIKPPTTSAATVAAPKTTKEKTPTSKSSDKTNAQLPKIKKASPQRKRNTIDTETIKNTFSTKLAPKDNSTSKATPTKRRASTGGSIRQPVTNTTATVRNVIVNQTNPVQQVKTIPKRKDMMLINDSNPNDGCRMMMLSEFDCNSLVLFKQALYRQLELPEVFLIDNLRFKHPKLEICVVVNESEMEIIKQLVQHPQQQGPLIFNFGRKTN